MPAKGRTTQNPTPARSTHSATVKAQPRKDEANVVGLDTFDNEGQYPIVVELKRMLWGRQSFELSDFELDENGIYFEYPNLRDEVTRVWIPRDQIGIITQRLDDPEEDESDVDDDDLSDPLEPENAEDELK